MIEISGNLYKGKAKEILRKIERVLDSHPNVESFTVRRAEYSVLRQFAPFERDQEPICYYGKLIKEG